MRFNNNKRLKNRCQSYVGPYLKTTTIWSNNKRLKNRCQSYVGPYLRTTTIWSNNKRLKNRCQSYVGPYLRTTTIWSNGWLTAALISLPEITTRGHVLLWPLTTKIRKCWTYSKPGLTTILHQVSFLSSLLTCFIRHKSCRAVCLF